MADNSGLEETSKRLRNELKLWEKLFAAANNGRKAGRDDIKADADISQKYKEYNRIRDILSGKVLPTASPKQSRKRRAVDELAQTPSKKRSSPAATPSKTRSLNFEECVLPPEESTPAAKRSMIGPTPQKNGKLLGIFDILPSRSPSAVNRVLLGNFDSNVIQTPSKSVRYSTLQVDETARHSKTPQSSGKRFMLDLFCTPQKPKDDSQLTPSSSMRAFATPAFLRRHTIPMDVVGEEATTPEQRQPWKRKSFGRSLSSMIEEMRKQEDHEHDEELDILREMEGGPAATEPSSQSIPSITKQMVQGPEVSVALDVDGFVPSDIKDNVDPAQEQETEGPPRKVWKKKGLKRQTRRVIMRPVKKQAPSQLDSTKMNADTMGHDEVAGASDHGEDSDFADTSNEKQQKESDKGKGEPNGPKKSKRKIKADSLAHANFVRLKIKSKNAKGKGRGRFGRK